MRFALVLSLLISLVAVVFALQNPGEMRINLPFTDSQLVSSQPVVLISTLLIGILIGWLASLPGRIGAGLRARRAEKQLGERSSGHVAPAAPAPVARVEASDPGPASAPATSSEDALETQRLADEVARRTAEIQRDLPPESQTEG